MPIEATLIMADTANITGTATTMAQAGSITMAATGTGIVIAGFMTMTFQARLWYHSMAHVSGQGRLVLGSADEQAA
jgi:hypothetical protein